MGWSNPPVPWSELERALSGRPPKIQAYDSHPAFTAADRLESRATPVDLPGRTAVPYAELHCHSAFSFLDGSSAPEELVAEAARLGLDAIAITDHDGFYGVVRFAEAAADAGIRAIYGAELSLDLPGPQMGVSDPVGTHLLVLARGQEGYRLLSQQIGRAQMAGREKGRPVYRLTDLAAAADGHWVILTGCRKGAVRRALRSSGPAAAGKEIDTLVGLFGQENVLVELTRHHLPTDDEDNDALAALAADRGLPVVATTAAHYATPDGNRLAAAMGAVRARNSLEEAEPYLPAGPGAHLRSGAEMAELFERYPTAVPTAARIGLECSFDLTLVAPELPPFDIPDGHDDNSWLRELTLRGALDRYGSPQDNPKAYRQIEKELAIIAQLNFPGYFLIVDDIVRFCRTERILCQGRGSAANSAVCYALGITAVDAVRYELLFERFLAPERDGPPDIDIDIESDRREEVIQYVYNTYGRDKAAQVANVNTYRPRMAVRDMAKALGYSPGQQDAFSKHIDGWTPLAKQESEDADVIPAEVMELAKQIQGLPRHLSIHSGGMVICDRPIAEVCPVEWARMENRSVLQWDKDDCASIGLVKFDLLGLGMLSALHYAVDLVAEHEGIEIDFAALDLEEQAVYAMLQKADSVGVFQVESRAQMATLPRLKPRKFYDLVVEVALIRPGPIQGGSVHPYIRRRNGLEPSDADHPAMENALGKTLGIPLFQEQLMQLAIDVAGFDAGEADQLRRAMGSKRSAAKMERLRQRLYEGMESLHGITGDLADRIYERLRAFANFGFAESHALSFAALVFYSAYLKLHHPAAFCAALLRAQPMGFYSPQSLVADARRHGVTIHRPDVNRSGVEADLEPGPNGKPAVRLGLSGVRTIGVALAERIVQRRPPTGYRDLDALTRTVTLTAAQAEALATAGALDSMNSGVADAGTDRRRALWAAGAAAGERAGTLPGSTVGLEAPALPGMSDLELTMADLWSTGISPEVYPTVFSREELRAKGVRMATDLAGVAHGTRVLVAGVVTHRQRPATASGIIFINLEDESGMINIVCSVGLWGRFRRVARGSSALLVRGMLERDGASMSILADRMATLDVSVPSSSRDFR
ncbi:error-prone DNA polymerase [Nakamurella silvestris]|nr:error-prone DNA polymerase [Nakamurella silvestris]